MRRILALFFVLFLFCAIFTYAEEGKRFNIYTEKGAASNHFIPSGWMGDTGDLKLSDQNTQFPFSGTTCIRVIYTARRTNGQGWAGIYWQSSQNNWGKRDTGFDLTGFNKLVFKARGSNGGEIIDKVKVGGIIKDSNGENVPFPDSADVEYGPIRLTKEWQEYSVNLTDKDMHYLNGGFAVIFNADQAGGEQTIYLDDIYFTFDPELKKEEVKINFPLYVYADSSSLDNHFVPSGWMPDERSGRDIILDTKYKDSPHSGDSCIRVEYKNNSGAPWAGICWQQPANNWGTVPDAGYNLQGATKLTFWAKGEKGGEVINEFKIGGLSSGEYPDSDSAGIGPVQLTKEWKKYEIDLRGNNLSYVIGGFCWATNLEVNDPQGIVFYLDDIKYEKD
jgi:hypothetical protein